MSYRNTAVTRSQATDALLHEALALVPPGLLHLLKTSDLVSLRKACVRAAIMGVEPSDLQKRAGRPLRRPVAHP